MELADAHCHLADPRLAPHLAGVLDRAAASGLVLMVATATRYEDWQILVDLAGRHPSMVPALGVHPWHAGVSNTAGYWALGPELEKHPGAAIGEIGLDGITGDPAAQEEIFSLQLEQAQEHRRPFILHGRKSWPRIFQMLVDKGPFPAGFVVHACPAELPIIARILELGGNCSFATPRTTPGKAWIEAVKAVPDDRLLVESDAPDLVPTTWRTPLHDAQGRPLSEPAVVALAVAAVAQARDADPERIAGLTLANTRRIFRP